jgi:enoyl-CoA hydratase/carnithine racemase
VADTPFVTLERRPDGVALVRLDRPKANALSGEVLAQLKAAADALRSQPPGAVVLWGGERVFAAGADISELDGGGPEAVSANFHAALGAWSAIPRATIAAINGYALGGGLEVALACDLRVGAENSKLGLPEVLLGVIPGGGGTQRLPRLIGASRAKDLVMTGRQVRGAEALAMGLVDRVAPAAEVLGVALALAAELAKGALLAQAAAKAAIDRGLEMSLHDGMAFEREQFLTTARSEDAARGVASFLQHGPGRATFVGR